MAQGALAERQQGDLDVGRIPAREDREIGPIEVRRGADRSQDVGGQREMQHLLLGDVDDRLLPRVNAAELLGRYSLADVALQRELGVEVLAEQAVLELTGLSEQVHQLLPAVHRKRWFKCLSTVHQLHL